MAKPNYPNSGGCSSTTSASKTSPEDLRSCITQKAKELWEKRGKPQGKDTEIWLEAERLVKGR